MSPPVPSPDQKGAPIEAPARRPVINRRELAQVAAMCPASLNEDEPLLQEDPDRLTILPLRDPEIYEFYKTMTKLFWNEDSVSLREDKYDWECRLTPGQRVFYTQILGFLAVSDELVLKNIDDFITKDVGLLELKHAYAAQSVQETVHSNNYAKQVIAICADAEEQARVLGAARSMPAVQAVVDWIKFWLSRDVSYGLRMLISAVLEGVLFSCHFLAIQLLRTQGLLPGITIINQYIRRDEWTHCMLSCFQLSSRRVRHPPPQHAANVLCESAVAVVDEFIRCSLETAAGATGLPVDQAVHRVTAKSLGEHVRYTADLVLKNAGYKPLYCVEQSPYPDEDQLDLGHKANFFETTVTDYAQPADFVFELHGDVLDRARSMDEEVDRL